MYTSGYAHRSSAFSSAASKIARVSTENTTAGLISEVVYREDQPMMTQLLLLPLLQQSAQYCVKHPPVWLTYKKCGRSVTLNYYRVDESLWRNQLKLVRLSKYSLDAALKEKSTRNTRERLKDLPNMSFHLEAILGEVGIKDVRALRILGAKMCWLRLRQQNSLVTEKILFMLEGAIIGIHEAALPVARRQELAEWADSLTPKQEFPAELE
jgi:DNA transformation protein and related proteins